MASRSTTTLVLTIASIVLFLAGFVFLAFYVTSAAGPHLRYLGAGFLAACAAFVVGCMVGLIVGIPRFVSSGAMRHAIEAKVARTATAGPAKARAAWAAPSGHGQAAQAQPGAGQPGAGQPAAGQAEAQPAQGAHAAQATPGSMAPMGPMTPMTLVASGAQQESARTTAPDGFPAITDQGAADQGAAGQASADQGAAGQGGAGQGGAGQVNAAPGDAGQDDGTEVGQLTPSTNLAEISDWLTKLLLGAGLVELTRLGHPLSSLIDAVARGLQGIPAGGAVTGTPVLVAASMLVMYVVLGFLDGYVVTTLWYGKYLQRLGYG
jgi:hypothetical protein